MSKVDYSSKAKGSNVRDFLAYNNTVTILSAPLWELGKEIEYGAAMELIPVPNSYFKI